MYYVPNFKAGGPYFTDNRQADGKRLMNTPDNLCGPDSQAEIFKSSLDNPGNYMIALTFCAGLLTALPASRDRPPDFTEPDDAETRGTAVLHEAFHLPGIYCRFRDKPTHVSTLTVQIS